MPIETPRGPGNNDDLLRRIAERRTAEAQAARATQVAREQADVERQQAVPADQQGVNERAVNAQTGPLGAQGIAAPAPGDALPPVLDPEAPELAQQPQDVKDALKALTAITDGLHGSPAERTAAIARALAQAKPLQEQLGKLQGLPPAFQAAVQEEVGQLNQAASPGELANLLKNQVDFKDLPMDAVADLGRLRVLNDPGLQGELDALAGEAMSAGAINADSMTAHPELGVLIAPLQDSHDKALKQQVHDTLRFVSDGLLTRHFAGADPNNKDELKQRLKDAAAEMADLAGRTGTGPVFKDAFQDSAGGNDLAKKATHKHQNAFERATSAVGNLVGDVVGAAEDLGKGFVNVARDAANLGLHGLGEVVDLGAHAEGAFFKFQADTLAAGLDAVGADGAGSFVRGAGERVKKDIDGAGDVAKFALDTAGTLIGEGPMAAVNDVADKVIGPEVPAFKGQLDGVTGAITNRLNTGDSVFMKLEVTGEVSFGDQVGATANGAGAKAGQAAFVGAKVTGGATLGRNPDGTLSLTLETSGKVQAGVKEEAKAKLGSQGVDLEAKASLAATGTGKVVLTFDPKNPDDVKRLKAITEPTPAKIAAAMVNPLAAAAITGPALKDAMEHNLASTEAGIQAGVEVTAKAEAVIGKKALVRAGLDASAVVGQKEKRNRDGSTETTTFLKAGATASLVASDFTSKLGTRQAFGANAAASVTVKTDKDGNIIGLSGEEDAQVGAGAQSFERRDVKQLFGEAKEKAAQGSVTKTQKSAGVNTNELKTETHTLTPQGLEVAKRRMAAGEPALKVFMDLDSQPGMSTRSRLTVDTTDVSVGLELDVKVLAGAKLGGKVSLGKSHATFEQLDQAPPVPQSSLAQDMAQDGPGNGGRR